ncbi:hypothetical protein [Kribbella sp. NPDC000426]|uniref:Rv1733c family protein n=1 Tax=Kribbella sp. NPDC000426 TaxID=3154255 RepID=UPI00332EB919
MSAVMHRSGELWVLMQARRLGFGRNSLRRPSDRLEAALLWCALIAALVMLPVGAAVGTGLQSSLDASAARQRTSLHEVQGRALESADRSVPSVPADVLSMVRVSYVDLHGTERVGMRSVVIGTKAGDTVPVWLDGSGNIVTAPRSKSDSAAFGATLGIFTVLGAWLLLWGLFRLVRVPLDRRRYREWTSEWLSVAPRWLRGQR